MNRYTTAKNKRKTLIKRKRKLNKFLKLLKYYPIISCVIILILTITITTGIVMAVANYDFLEIKSKNNLGDAMGGIANPIIAFIGVFVTFLAFYIQYKFNREQSKLIAQQRSERIQDKSDRDIELSRQNFDSKFYELLRLHNENVKNISTNYNSEVTNGKRCFDKFIAEIHFLILCIEEIKSKKEPSEEINFKEIFDSAFYIFFYGIRHEISLENDAIWEENILNLNKWSRNNPALFQRQITSLDMKLIGYPDLNFFVADGYSSELSNYFNFLFFILKTINEVNQSILSYTEKRNYTDILRSQLTENEQILLFYYWHSGIGIEFEDNKYKFLTDFRMVNDIQTFNIFHQLDINEILNLKNSNIKKIDDDDQFYFN